MPMSPRLLRPRTAGNFATDADARAYIEAVRLADGQYLERGVQVAVDAFVIGCKSDGIWLSLKASCILMGARTLAGALVPLVGAAPTNNNFVSGDYDRKIGLLGNGTNKSIDSNRAGNADPLNSIHVAIYKSDATSGTNPYFIGANESASTATAVGQDGVYCRTGDSPSNIGSGFASSAAGLHGVARSSSTAYAIKRPTISLIAGSRAASSMSLTRSHAVFAVKNSSNVIAQHSASRFAFYSIGENINLTALDSRVSSLYTAIGNAIP